MIIVEPRLPQIVIHNLLVDATFLGSPKLLSQSPGYFETYVGSHVSIHCAFSGLPTPTITWKRVNGNISSAASISFTTATATGGIQVVNSSVTLTRTEKNALGTYECFARNFVGSSSAKISVNVTCEHHSLIIDLFHIHFARSSISYHFHFIVISFSFHFHFIFISFSFSFSHII